MLGDNFFDPGGPGGSSTGGTPGNYPSCACTTLTTLAGITEIPFNDFSVFATFDWLRIYDSADTAGAVLYDNSTGDANEGDITLADMIASNGPATFVGASGDMTFEFFATGVVDYGGWDSTITVASGGGAACNQDNPSNAFENAFTTSTNQAQIMETDITVDADTDFNLETITVNLMVNPGETIASADITLYNDDAGLPDPASIVDAQVAVVPSSQSIIGTVFALDVIETIFDITPTMLAGQAGVSTQY